MRAAIAWKTAAPVAPGTSSRPASSRISSSVARAASTSGLDPTTCVSAVVPPVPVRADDHVGDHRLSGCDTPAARDPDRAADLSRVVAGEQVGEELDRLAVGDLGGRLRRREHLDLRGAPLRGGLADRPLAQPAQPVGVEHATSSSSSLRRRMRTSSSPAGTSPADTRASRRPSMPPRPSAIPTRLAPARAGIEATTSARSGAGFSSIPKPRTAEAAHDVGLPERLGDRHLVSHHDQRTLAAAVDDEAGGAAVVPGVAREVVHLVGAEGDDAVDRLLLHPAPQALEAMGWSRRRDAVADGGGRCLAHGLFPSAGRCPSVDRRVPRKGLPSGSATMPHRARGVKLENRLPNPLDRYGRVVVESRQASVCLWNEREVTDGSARRPRRHRHRRGNRAGARHRR